MEEKRLQLNIALCDDESPALEKMEALCRRILGTEYDLNLFPVTDPQMLDRIRDPIQIALLDVQMPGVDGIETARRLMQRFPGCRILFVSGFLSSVSPVYTVPHLCLILKEQLEQELPGFLSRAAGMAAREAGRTLSVNSSRSCLSLPLENIVYLERQGHWTHIHMADGTCHETREKLDQLFSRMGGVEFIRCHVSYIVSLRQVQSMDAHELRLYQGLRIPVSRPHEAEVRDAFFRHISEMV